MVTIIEVVLLTILVVSLLAMAGAKLNLNKMSEEERQEMGVQFPHYSILKTVEKEPSDSLNNQ